MATDPIAGPVAPPVPVELGAVVDLVVEHVAADPALAPRVGPNDPRSRRRQIADLVRCASDTAAGAPGAADVIAPAGLDLDHLAFSLLASHLADVLDALGVDESRAADLLAGLAAVRGAVVRPSM